MFGSLTL